MFQRLTALALLAFCPVTLFRAAEPNLNAKLTVNVAPDLAVTCYFDLDGTKDQSFKNTEYRFKVLDSDLNEVKALSVRQPNRTIELPRNLKLVSVGGSVLVGSKLIETDRYFRATPRTVDDSADALIQGDKLKSGESYILIVKVRNLSATTSFKAP